MLNQTLKKWLSSKGRKSLGLGSLRSITKPLTVYRTSKRQRRIAYVPILLALLYSLPVSAEKKDAVPISKNDPAPFSGQLLPTELAITIGQKAAYCDEEKRIAITQERLLSEIALKAQARITDIERERADGMIKAAEETASEADSFFRSFEFGLIIGFGSAAALGFAFAYGVRR